MVLHHSIALALGAAHRQDLLDDARRLHRPRPARTGGVVGRFGAVLFRRRGGRVGRAPAVQVPAGPTPAAA